MFFIVLPLSFVDRTTGVVKGSLSVPLTLIKVPFVLIALGILRSIHSHQDPDVRALTMLSARRAREIQNNTNLVYVNLKICWICMLMLIVW